MSVRFVLASASPARLSTLRQAGIRPEVIVSGVDESGLDHLGPAELARQLATLKAEAVHGGLDVDPADTTIVVGCDSVLELGGQAYGKPHSPELAVARWRAMRGNIGTLHTGHHVIRRQGEAVTTRTKGAATTVHFADLSDAEIDAYVATGEPLVVAGAFTVDGLGGPFVTRLEGDYHNVVGISLPLLRTMLLELGISWPELWT
ncbi:MAG: Maf family protein [Propionibacteriaceae bacterium]